MSMGQTMYFRPKSIGDYGDTWLSTPSNKIDAVKDSDDNKFIYLNDSNQTLKLLLCIDSFISTQEILLSSIYKTHTFKPSQDPSGNNWTWETADIVQIGVNQLSSAQSFKCHRVPTGLSTVNSVGIVIRAKYTKPYCYIKFMEKEISYQ